MTLGEFEFTFEVDLGFVSGDLEGTFDEKPEVKISCKSTFKD
jgi:hypothetical protein